MNIRLIGGEAPGACSEASDRIVGKHELYCTVRENNNGDCEVHDTVRDMGVTHQRYPFERKPYETDNSRPFYRYDPDQCILSGRCVEACQNVAVNETLDIAWSREHPRVIWDDDRPIDESSCVGCGQCVTVCPCNALMEKTMLGRAGPFTGISEEAKRPLIDTVKAVEPIKDFKPIMGLSQADEAMRRAEIKRTKTVCTYCGVGCAFEMWTRGREILKVQPHHQAPANGISTCIKGKFGWDFVNSDQRLTTPLIRENGRFREAGWDEALDLVARRLSEVSAEHGADALSFVTSSKCTNDVKARQRMVAQYAIASRHRGLVVGTDQAAEAVMGFFTKFGDGAADVTPLFGLTKRQVRAVARALGAPSQIVDKQPTADLETLRPQRPDEDVFGVSYADIDTFLEGGEVGENARHTIIEAYEATRHKRAMPAAP